MTPIRSDIWCCETALWTTSPDTHDVYHMLRAHRTVSGSGHGTPTQYAGDVRGCG